MSKIATPARIRRSRFTSTLPRLRVLAWPQKWSPIGSRTPTSEKACSVRIGSIADEIDLAKEVRYIAASGPGAGMVLGF